MQTCLKRNTGVVWAPSPISALWATMELFLQNRVSFVGQSQVRWLSVIPQIWNFKPAQMIEDSSGRSEASPRHKAAFFPYFKWEKRISPIWNKICPAIGFLLSGCWLTHSAMLTELGWPGPSGALWPPLSHRPPWTFWWSFHENVNNQNVHLKGSHPALLARMASTPVEVKSSWWMKSPD